MGLNIKKKFFGIDYTNYLRISELKFNMRNDLSGSLKECWWDVTFKFGLNSESRDLEKICELIKSKEITIDIANEIEEKKLNELLTMHNSEDNMGFGNLGSITVSIPSSQLENNNIDATFYNKTSEEIFEYFYSIATNLYNFLGTDHPDNISVQQEDQKQFINKMIKKVKSQIKDIVQTKSDLINNNITIKGIDK